MTEGLSVAESETELYQESAVAKKASDRLIRGVLVVAGTFFVAWNS